MIHSLRLTCSVSRVCSTRIASVSASAHVAHVRDGQTRKAQRYHFRVLCGSQRFSMVCRDRVQRKQGREQPAVAAVPRSHGAGPRREPLGGPDGRSRRQRRRLRCGPDANLAQASTHGASTRADDAAHTPRARVRTATAGGGPQPIATAADSAAHGGARMINGQRQGRAPPPAAPFSIVATAAVHGKKSTKEYSPQRRPATAPLSPSGFIAASKQIHGGRQE